MRKLTTREHDHITRLIMKEVSFFNGWTVDDNEVESACNKAAEKVVRYMRKKLAPEPLWPQIRTNK